MPTGTWAGDWSTGNVVTASEFRKSLGCVADSTLGVAAASFDFTGLPTTYAHLVVELYLRGDNASASIETSLRFNNDSAANYDYVWHSASGTVGGSGSGAVAQTAAALTGTGTPANTAPANTFAAMRLVIPHYANAANHKAGTILMVSKTANTAAGTSTLSGGYFWRATAAISRITILPSAGNFVAGSRASVYVLGS